MHASLSTVDNVLNQADLFREKAARCWRCTISINDPEMIEKLMGLAMEYEEQAIALSNAA